MAFSQTRKKEVNSDVGATAPAVITAVSVSSITSSTCTITWTTDKAATSQVCYGKAPYTFDACTTEDLTLVTSHSVNVTGLLTNSTYLFSVRSRLGGANDGTPSHSAIDGYVSLVRGQFVTAPLVWTAGNALNSARANYGIAKLTNGNAIIAGGDAIAGSAGPAYKTCELFTASTNLWTVTGAMSTSRSWFGIVTLQDGKVLAMGGTTDGGTTFPANCELYDPLAATWSATTGSLIAARIQFGFWLLSNGKVLIAGGHHGSGGGNDLGTCELYNPLTKTWSATGSFVGNAVIPTGGPFAYKPRWPLCTTLGDGRPIAVGGTIDGGAQASKNVQTYDIASGTWTVRANAPDYISGIMSNCCATLPDGRIFIAGPDFDIAPNERASCYLYNGDTDTWANAPDLPQTAQGSQVWTRPDGKILQAGGSTDEDQTAVSYSAVFDGTKWTAISPISAGRMFASRCPGVVLDDGRCLFPGGQGTGGYTALSSTDICS